ncbi:metallophosphoesterase domain-containing protein 1-like isoform 2-T2 [Cochliomyia hominivorax]
MEIPVHPLTNSPNLAWQEISKTQNVTKITIEPPSEEISPYKARVVCMSDTHTMTSQLKFDVPQGDIFIHAGDFSNYGRWNEVKEFNDWIGSLPHKHKIVIAGNHELSFDPITKKKNNSTDEPSSNVRDALTNCTYIEDELIEIWGLRIYGSPWQPKYGNWAFNLPRGEALLEKWNKIPANIDILITHGPPIGHGDLCKWGSRGGCVELLTTIQKRVKPKYHIFGHIHEDYGVTTDGQVTYVNASTCDLQYIPINKPIVFDMELPSGICKD